MDFINSLELLVLGSRLKRLSDRLMVSVQDVYSSTDIDFQPRWFPVFRLLADQGPSSVGVMAHKLGLTHAAVSQTASAMSKHGVISSRKDPSDERRRVLDLTDDGRALLPRLREIWTDIESSVRATVDESGVDILAALEGVEHALETSSIQDRVATSRANRLMSAVEIVDFEPAYRDHFKDLNVEWLAKYFSVEPVDREVLWNPEVIIDDGGAILFARLGDEIVGTCALQRQGDKWELTKMAVTEAHQGRKIGKKLMLAALERARAMGMRELYLVTNSGLTPAVNLYRKVGFRVTSCEQHPKYKRGDLTMEITL